MESIKKQLIESEEIGNAILTNLSQEQEQLDKIERMMKEIDDNMKEGRSIIKSMHSTPYYLWKWLVDLMKLLYRQDTIKTQESLKTNNLSKISNPASLVNIEMQVDILYDQAKLINDSLNKQMRTINKINK